MVMGANIGTSVTNTIVGTFVKYDIISLECQCKTQHVSLLLCICDCATSHAAMGQLGDGDQLERAFGGATVHGAYNTLCIQ